MDKPIPEAWITPGGDVSRSFYWCLERCLPGQQPRPLYAAQQQGQKNPWQSAVDQARVAAHLGIAADNATCEEAAKQLAELIDWHIAVATDPAVNGGLSLQPMQQGGGEVVEPMTGDLLPCPFCGASKHLYVEHLEGTIIHPAFRVRCDLCGASSAYTDKDCRAAWNQRAPSRIASP